MYFNPESGLFESLTPQDVDQQLAGSLMGLAGACMHKLVRASDGEGGTDWAVENDLTRRLYTGPGTSISGRAGSGWTTMYDLSVGDEVPVDRVMETPDEGFIWEHTHDTGSDVEQLHWQDGDGNRLNLPTIGARQVKGGEDEFADLVAHDQVIEDTDYWRIPDSV